MSVAPDNVIPFYNRTSNGAEIDLVFEFSGKEKWAIEIKRNSSPSLSKGFHMACQDISPDKKFVVYSGRIGSQWEKILLQPLFLE